MTETPARRWIAAVVVAGAVGVVGIVATSGSDDDAGTSVAADRDASTTTSVLRPGATTSTSAGGGATATTAGDGTATSGGPSSTTTTTTPPGTVTLTGTGDGTVDVVKPQVGVPALLVATHDGAGPFQVTPLDAGGVTLPTVIDTTTPGTGTYLLDGGGEETAAFAVTAPGTWTLEVRPIASVEVVPLTLGKTGSGAAVFLLVGLQAGRNVAITNDGTGPFHVTFYTDHREDLVTTVGAYDDTFLLPGQESSAIITVESDGDWSFASG